MTTPKNSKNWMTRHDGQHSTLPEGFGSLTMRRNLWGNADSVDNERNGLLARVDSKVPSVRGSSYTQVILKPTACRDG
jgi:hypothetical protein